jgi:DNA repair protein SbcC/Rad50
MIVKKLKLENIRSYKDQVIEFPLGKTLFEGDIGSGKSTILMAIEFALFGLGSEKPGSLLKAGESEGSVSIIFEADEGQEYTVQRRLVKKKSAYSQEKCILKTEQGAIEYSPSEIKERVLEILGFNEPPDPKAQSLIYRYAIYTPQEEIKSVLALKPDLRLQTMRKAFRLEDYKVAVENANNLHREIRDTARDYEREASEIPEIKEKIRELESWTSSKLKELDLVENEQVKRKDHLARLKANLDKLQEEQLSLKSDAGRIQDLLSLIDNKKMEVQTAGKQIESLESNLGRIRPKIDKLKVVTNPSEKSVEDLQKEVQAYRNREKVFRAEETKIRSKLEDYDAILKEKICPTCEQEIEAAAFGEKLAHKQSELRDSLKKADDCARTLEQLETKLLAKRDYEQAQASLVDLTRNHSEYLENLGINRAKLEVASKTVQEGTRELDKVKESVQKLVQIEAELDRAKKEIDKLDKELQESQTQVATGRAQIAEWKRQSGQFEESLKKKIEQKQKADKLGEYTIWIQDYFAPTVESIERQVLNNINVDFDIQFQKWFGMLVDDPGKQAKIDEDFTPIIEQDGIDQDVAFLSGGEKTSVALAYRLALNSIVRKVSTGMHSNVLILDEPTDGFSKEQLSRVREILDELECPQIILVSHERELESFADQIFRVTKNNGVSTISGGA